jgi:hypothetical protein
MALAWAPDLASVEQMLTALRAGSQCRVFTEAQALLQPVLVREDFSVGFSLPMSAPPIARAQHELGSLGGKGRIALGWVVAFRDLNGNGVLDTGPDAVLEPVDASSLPGAQAVLFLDGELPWVGVWEGWGVGLSPGFHILGHSPQSTGEGPLQVFPAQTPLALGPPAQRCP